MWMVLCASTSCVQLHALGGNWAGQEVKLESSHSPWQVSPREGSIVQSVNPVSYGGKVCLLRMYIQRSADFKQSTCLILYTLSFIL